MVGEAGVHSSPAMALAARFPKLWMAASSPNAEPRSWAGAATAMAACSARISVRADRGPGGDKAASQQDEVGPAGGKAEVGNQEQTDAGGQDEPVTAVVGQLAGWDAGQGGGQVVAGVEQQGELRGGRLPMIGGE